MQSIQGKKALIFFIIVITAVNAKYQWKYCDVYSDSGDPKKHCYLKESLFSIAHSPNQLAFDPSTNELYFSFDFGQGEYIPAVLKMSTNKVTVLKGVKDAFAMSRERVSGDMFFGGSHGIYRYSPSKRTLKRLNNKNLDIWWLFVKRNIYFIKFPTLNAFLYANRTIIPVPELNNNIVHQFVFDNEDNLFFINSTGLYGVKHDGNRAILLRDNPKFVGMATDNAGHVYVSSEDGIYVVSKIIQKVKRIVRIQGVLGMTFDKDNNVIYSNSHEIFRLISLSKEKNNV